MNKEELVDKIVREWSCRCEKGYPDLNNEQDLKLFEGVFGFSLKDVIEDSKREFDYRILEDEEQKSDSRVDSIIDMVKANKDNEKVLTRVYRTLQASSDIPELKKKLSDAGLSKDLFDNRDLFAEIINILQKGDKSSIKDLLELQEKNELPNSGNVYTGSNDIPTEKLKKIGGLTGAKSSVAIGKGEILFPILYSDIKLKDDGAGDLTRGGKAVEVKAIGVSREGKLAAGGRFGTSRGGAHYTYKSFFPDGPKGFFKAINDDIENAIKADTSNIDNVFEHINKYLKKIYPKSTQEEISKATYEDLRLTLKKAAVENYIEEKNIDEFLLFNPVDGNFILISPATDFLKKLESGDVILSTNPVPQLMNFN